MLRFARSELRFEDEGALGDDGLTRLQAFENLDAAAASFADRDRGSLKAALHLDEHDVATLNLLDALFG